MKVYNRHGQSEARGPHAALQLIFAALGPLNNFKKSLYFKKFSQKCLKMTENDPKKFFGSAEMMNRLNNAARGHN